MFVCVYLYERTILASSAPGEGLQTCMSSEVPLFLVGITFSCFTFPSPVLLFLGVFRIFIESWTGECGMSVQE